VGGEDSKMSKIVNPNIKLKETIDQNDYNSINNLQQICLKVDQTTLKLEIEYKLSMPKGESKNLNSINEFMYYDENNLLNTPFFLYSGCTMPLISRVLLPNSHMPI
jgi:hypothetical protein